MRVMCRWVTLGVCFVSLSTASLPAATIYWDTNGASAGLGGAGTWQDTAGNWSTDTSGTLITTWTNANRDTADFRGTGAAVNLSGTVQAGSIVFNSTGYTLSGSDLTIGRSSGSASFTALSVASGSGTGANTVSSNIVIDDVGSVAAATTYTFNVASASTLTLGGNISLNYASGTPSGNKTIAFTTGSSSSVVYLNGAVSSGANGGGSSLLGMSFGSGGSSQSNANAINGVFHVSGNNSGVGRGSTINGGTVYVENNNAMGTGTVTFGSSGARGDMKLLTNGAYTVANAMSMSGASTSQTYIGGNTADDSLFTGDFNMNAFGTNGSPGVISTPDAILTAATNGKVTFSGNMNASASIPRGIVKEGNGVVSLSRAAGNTYKGETKINAGTLLIMNTTGSATGDASQLAAGAVAVSVAGGARLGGNGYSTVKVGALSANSLFSAGDMTRLGVSSIGTLHLTGGLSAASGATFEYDINGASVDLLDFGSAALDLDGIATFNFTSLGTVNTGVAYTLFTGSGDWTGSSASFVFNGPSGYVLDTSYGSGTGYIWDNSSNLLSVQFAAVPEPSTYAMLISGCGLLYMLRRRSRS